ncbi:MAG: hypothetical protein ACYC64_12325 [Armatimonadota bacterium]
MNRIAIGFTALAVVLLSLFRPALPEWAGMGLIILAVHVGSADMRAPQAKQRWAAFKRMALVTATGAVLICSGLMVHSAPWDIQPASSEMARSAMLALLIYSVSLLGAPALGWAYVSHRALPGTRQARPRQPVRTLSSIADQNDTRRLRAAV